MDIFERFYDKVQMEPNSGCWLWDGAGDTIGYGTFRVNGATRKAHRASYELHVGPIPDGLELDHLCRMRCCVNPDHLEPVTHKENCRRGNGGYNSSKTSCPRGHPYAGDNLQVSPSGRRHCRECRRKSAMRSYYKTRGR